MTQLHLNAFLMSAGHHEAAWRLPETDAVGATGLDHFVQLARLAEEATFDSLFLADSPVLHSTARRPSSVLEPTVLLTALAGVTSRIGLIATASTSYNEPYNLARRFASLDHVSGGRAGWNIVTTAGPDAARNFNLDEQASHRDRYRRADEFVEVCRRLWDSWDDDAVLADKERGVWADPDRVRPIEHRGEFFAVHGPLNVSRSPQGRPLLVQAGSSEDGKDFAARHADAVFTAQQTVQDARAFYDDLKRRTARQGRDPERVKVLPGIVPVLGSTEQEARQRAALFDEHVQPEFARAQLARTLRVPLERLQLDEQLPDDLPSEDEIEGAKSRFTLIVSLARSERLTVRELILRLGGGRGHHTFTGTPEQVADTIEEWATTGAADGFNIMPPALPGDLRTFVEHVVPILRDRGLFRREYTGRTLHEHYGLPRPVPAAAAEVVAG
ncbi:LLM class flavin-dependent oxidoreductase [Desertihabitans aurantiacus]|uniref:LLM class flavin-dependent oxidoreductase n=1 Tax=Desertihabitans aurantiacus TaxID=2282477 RepID=UPI000DF7960F|nr:LLM class flavin-dependent oxidoreductase [Desertihabitans aurantiacus]